MGIGEKTVRTGGKTVIDCINKRENVSHDSFKNLIQKITYFSKHSFLSLSKFFFLSSPSQISYSLQSNLFFFLIPKPKQASHYNLVLEPGSVRKLRKSSGSGVAINNQIGDS